MLFTTAPSLRNDGKSRRYDRGSGESQAAMRRAGDGVREGSLWGSGLIALCLSANLIVTTAAAAQTAPGSTAVTSPLSIVHDDDHVVQDPGEPAFAGDGLPTTLRLPLVTHIWPPPRFAGNVRDGTFGQQRLRSRDSLRNGAIIGTVIGAAALGAFAATLCNAYQEEGGASCLPDTLRIAAIGGAIGLGAGLAIDAARSQSGVTVFVGIRF